MDQKQLFDFMLRRVEETSHQTGLREPQAFIRWFAELYYARPQDSFVSDGSNDGKVDYFFSTHNGSTVEHHVVNGKFTHNYNNSAPAKFYEELIYFWHAFDNRANREPFLESNVKPALRAQYRKLFDYYDDGRAHLMFVTNHRRGSHYGSIKFLEKEDAVRVFHLEDLLQHLVDDLDGAMPRTPEMLLTGVNQVLSPATEDTRVSMSIVFARLADFVGYMKTDRMICYSRATSAKISATLRSTKRSGKLLRNTRLNSRSVTTASRCSARSTSTGQAHTSWLYITRGS